MHLLCAVAASPDKAEAKSSESRILPSSARLPLRSAHRPGVQISETSAEEQRKTPVGRAVRFARHVPESVAPETQGTSTASPTTVPSTAPALGIVSERVHSVLEWFVAPRILRKLIGK